MFQKNKIEELLISQLLAIAKKINLNYQQVTI